VNISEIFYSIEGEGIEIGRPEVFIRLSKCNLKCVWCDTKYALNKGKQMSIESIIQKIEKYPCKSISITGGEPLLQNEELFGLISKLKQAGFWVQINTNGTLFDKQIFDMVNFISMDCKCPSSEMISDLEVIVKVRDLFSNKTQFKFVISNEEDYLYAKKISTSLLEDSPNVVFQPQWSKRIFTKEIVTRILNDNLHVRLILQQHKIIWGIKKGV
jgi:7-carboxy-7-deazaguanine synthase